jgi:hypothetical protein
MSGMTATAADYAWVEQGSGLSEAYCLTMVRDLSPEEILARMGAKPEETITGLPQLVEPSYEAWDDYDGDQMLVGVASLDGWAVAVEINGYIGVTPSVAKPLSTGTRLVSHFRNINAVDHFFWIEDGDIRVTFEPLFPAQRLGSRPDALVEEMQAAGFDLSDDEDRDYTHHTAAAFALAEHLTGVRLTKELLEGAILLCGMAPRPR